MLKFPALLLNSCVSLSKLLTSLCYLSLCVKSDNNSANIVFRAGDRWGLNKLIHWKHLKHYPKWKWSERYSDLQTTEFRTVFAPMFFFHFLTVLWFPPFPLLLFFPVFWFYNWAFQVISGSDRSDRVLILGKRTVTKPGYFGAYVLRRRIT